MGKSLREIAKIDLREDLHLKQKNYNRKLAQNKVLSERLIIPVEREINTLKRHSQQQNPQTLQEMEVLFND